MKLMKRLLALVCISVLTVVSFAGCSSKGERDNPATVNGTSDDSSETAENAEIVNLKMIVATFGTTPTDFDEVVSKVNEISEKEIGVHVDITPLSFGDYTTQVNLMLSSNEELDILPVLSSYFTSYIAKGQLLPVDEELAAYGKGIIEAVGENYLNAGKVNGEQYGITTVRDLAVSYGIMMRADLAEKYGVTYDTIDSLAEFESVLKAVKEGEQGITPLVPPVEKASWFDMYGGYDGLSNGLGALLDPANSLTVSNLYESENYSDFINLMRDWYQKGYILEDSSTATEVGPSLVKAGRAFAYICTGKPGIVIQEEGMAGYKLKYVTFREAQTSTTMVQTLQWALPINCKDTKKSMEFLNLMYTNSDLENLLSYGIEGKHYVRTQDGHITYPEGVDATNTGYGLNMGWQMGNQFLTHVWEGNDLNIWDQMKSFNESAVVSAAMGFSFDSANVKTEVAACTSVTDQYRTALECGMVDPDKILPEFIQALKNAGIDRIIAEKQAQIDAWSTQ